MKDPCVQEIQPCVKWRLHCIAAGSRTRMACWSLGIHAKKSNLRCTYSECSSPIQATTCCHWMKTPASWISPQKFVFFSHLSENSHHSYFLWRKAISAASPERKRSIHDQADGIVFCNHRALFIVRGINRYIMGEKTRSTAISTLCSTTVQAGKQVSFTGTLAELEHPYSEDASALVSPEQPSDLARIAQLTLNLPRHGISPVHLQTSQYTKISFLKS